MTKVASARPRGRPTVGSSPVSEEHMLEAALRAFATYGYEGVSLRTLSRALGVSHNLLPQKFGSKRSLWFAAVDHAFTPFLTALLSDPAAEVDGLSRLRRFFESFALYSSTHPDLLRLINAEGSLTGERLDYICERFIEPVSEHVIPIYRAMVADGNLREVPLPTLYYMMTSGAAAMYTSDALTRRLFGGAALNRSKRTQHARAVADLIIEGLRPKPA